MKSPTLQKLLRGKFSALCFVFVVIAGHAFGQSEPNDPITYDTTISEKANGEGPFNWLVRITRQKNDPSPRPVFFSMPGAGEVGTNPANLVAYGPHYWLNNGWDGGVTLGNGKHYPILITVQQPANNMRPWHLKAVIDILLNTFPIKRNSVHVAGLSQGSYEWGELIGFAASPGDETAMSMIKSWVNLQGVGPGDNFLGFDPPYPQAYATWAKKYGGKLFGLEGTTDSRNIWQISQAMNAAAPNSAYFSYENLGGGAHCCWNSMYDPSVKNWSVVAPIVNTNIVKSTNPATTTGSYYYSATTGSNIFQWMLRQGDTAMVTGGPSTPPAPTPPTVNAGNPITITLPVASINLLGTASANGGATLSQTKWTATGPNTPVIVSLGSLATLVTGLVEGTYVFTLTATDNDGGTAASSVNVTVNPLVSTPPPPPPPTGATPKILVGTGEYQVFFIDQNKKLYGVGTNVRTLGVGNTGTPGTTLPVALPSNVTAKSVAAGLHGGAAIDNNGNVWAWGDNDQGQCGNGATSTTQVMSPVQVDKDNSGNAFGNVTSLCAYFSGNVSNGWYAIKADGTLWVWGQTLGGMAGDGTTGSTALTRPKQITIPGGRKAAQVSAGNHAILLCTDGTVFTFGGSGGNYQNLGYAVSGNSYQSLQQLTGLSGITQVSGGGGFNYALKSDGTLYGWGYYGYYMGGTGGQNSPIPTPVDLKTRLNLPKPIKQIVSNMVCTHVILTDGTLWGWGDNAQGTIGIGTEVNFANTTAPYAWDFLPAGLLQQQPVQVTTRNDFVAVFATQPFVMFTYAETADGQLYSWGRNKGGVIGNGVVACSSDVAASYPNSWDVPLATPVNPLSITKVTPAPSPYCLSHASTSPCNQCSLGIFPVANAGAAITIVLPTSSASLDGSASSNPDGSALTYSWSRISGPTTYTITNPTSAKTTVTGLVQGTYQFQLTVKNNQGNTATASVTVTVSAQATVTPVANAGSAISINLPANTVSLDGSASSSPDGSALTYEWAQLSGPTATIASPTAAKTAVNGLVQGSYQFQLTVKNSQGTTASATVAVTVKPAVVVTPIANAGSDITITLPTNSVSVDGSASTNPDGSALTYEWSELAGSTFYAITNPNAAKTTITGLAQGTYKFQLKVTNIQGNSATATVNITVKAAPVVTPVANAGSNVTITLPTSTAAVDGSASTDPGGSTLTYAWSQISGPATFTITSPTAAKTTITGLVQGTYKFQLQVTNTQGNSATATVTVTVNAAPVVTPVANAGNNATLTLPTSTASLDGSASTDPGGSTLTYEWSQISGPATYTITTPGAAKTTVTGLVQGIYKFQLKVTNTQGNSATATVTITVNAAPVIVPVANAGSDVTLTLPANTATVDGSASSTSGGGTLTYAWTKVSGPATYTITNPTAATTTITGLVQGSYQFQLTVTNSQGKTANDVVNVIVNNAAAVYPVAHAGSAITITLPANTASLDGSASTDPGGSVLTYAWSQISGPATYTITSPTAAKTTVTGLVQGIYKFQLVVTNSQGNTGTATVTVTVNAAPVYTPVADAGPDATITLPANSVTVDGSGSTTPGGGALTYAWTKVAGPATFTITSPTAATSTITGLVQGVYQFQVKVTNSQGNVATSTVTITVNAAPVYTPVSDAGPDVAITLPTNSVTVDGSASTNPGGGILAYVWTNVSGPATYNINSPGSAKTAITGLVQGVYQFQLKVTNSQGNSSVNTVTVTVNAAPVVVPVADAGPDVAITLPVNSVTVDGSASTTAGGGTLTYAWTKVSGPATFIITSPTAVKTTITGLVQGVYQFQLKVTNSQGYSGTNTVTVTVNAAPVITPIADAGPDIAITLPVNTVTVNGSGSTTSGGGTLTYAWTKLSGPTAYTITNPAAVSSTITGLVQGVYQFQLKVTNSQGNIATNTVAVTVNAAPVITPVANAGPDLSIKLPVNSVTLDGSGSSTPGGGNLTYTWTRVYGPTKYTIANPSMAKTVVGGLTEGVYQFQLKVTNIQGFSATATVLVTVIAPNEAPVANAGNDAALTLPANSLTLDGTKSYDPDGTLISYSWYKVSGPSASLTIVNSNTATSTVVGLSEGTYVFELKVTDNQGLSATDDVTVTVSKTPVNVQPVLTAFAGDDTLIALPDNSIILNGSGSTAVGGTITSYEWTQLDGPAQALLASAAEAVCPASALVAGKYLFQLTVMDDKGAIATDTVSVNVIFTNRDDTKLDVQLYPNPAQSDAQLRITSPVLGKMKISIYSMSGGLVQTMETDKTEAYIQQTIHVSRLARGTYVIQIVIGEGKTKIVRSLIKQ